MKKRDNFPLQILTSYQKALSHSLRTPLAVISTDLQYLSQKYPSEELEGTNAQCEKILDLIQEGELLWQQSKSIAFNLGRFLVDSGGYGGSLIVHGEVTIQAQREYVTYVIKKLGELFQWKRVELFSDSLLFTTSIERGVTERFETFMEFHETSLQHESFSAPVLDAVLRALGWSSDIEPSGETLTIRIRWDRD